jgi:hypothetical protein
MKKFCCILYGVDIAIMCVLCEMDGLEIQDFEYLSVVPACLKVLYSDDIYSIKPG